MPKAASEKLVGPTSAREVRPGRQPRRSGSLETDPPYVEHRFVRMRYILGLAIDFTLVAQQVSDIDPAAKAFRPKLTVEKLFEISPGSRSAG